jgi:hypothetical protein
MNGASQSAVIVTVPAAEDVLGRHRARFDVAAGWRVPAHVTAFPAYPPYGGEYDDVVPHLTVGHGVEGSNLRDVERQVLPHLPIHMEVTTAGLWVGSDAPGSWAQVAALPLG